MIKINDSTIYFIMISYIYEYYILWFHIYIYIYEIHDIIKKFISSLHILYNLYNVY